LLAMVAAVLSPTLDGMDKRAAASPSCFRRKTSTSLYHKNEWERNCPVVAIMLLTYLSDVLRQIMVGALPLHPLWLGFAVLDGWLVALLALAARF